MVIITRFSPGDEVWYYAKGGQFKTAKIYKIRTLSKVRCSVFYDIANIVVSTLKAFFKEVDFFVPDEDAEQETSIKYILDSGDEFEERQLFSSNAEAIDSIRLFPKHAQE